MDFFLPNGYFLAGYTIVKAIDRGGFGLTYLCESEQHGTVVLKELFPDDLVHRNDNFSISLSRQNDEFVERWSSAQENFVLETNALKNLSCSGVPKFLDRFKVNNTLYMAQEYIHGETLYNLQSEFSKLQSNKNAYLRHLLQSVLTVVAQVHNAGVLHRDIKPANIILRSTDESPVLIDFGAVRFQIGGKTFNFHKRVWSPGYSSYEQLDINGQEQKEASDLYSVAATFYYLMFGEEPTDSLDRLNDVAIKDFMTLSDQYDATILESLNKAFLVLHAQRFQAADEWLAYIQGGQSEAQTQPNDEEVQPGYLNSYWIGRAPEADDEGQLVYIDDTQESSLVSRTHAVVYEYQDSYLIKDVSSNGLSITIWNDALQTKDYRKIKGVFSTEEDVFTLDLAGYKLSSAEMLKSQRRTRKISGLEAGIDKVVAQTVERQVHHNADNISQAEPPIASVDLKPASFGRRLGSQILASVLYTIVLLIITLLAELEFNGIGSSISSFGWLIYGLITI